MRGEEYRRPLLCRLCECPVVDGGVQLQGHHLDRLSRWWKAHWDTDFEDESCIVCHFCVCDLKFAEEHSEEKEPANQIWWTKLESVHHNYYNYYYSDEWLKSCSVKITQLGSEKKLLEEYRQAGFGEQNLIDEDLDQCQTVDEEFKQTKDHKTDISLNCFFCGKVSTNRYNHIYHIQKHHSSQIIRCPNVPCRGMFNTTEERDKHIKDFHTSGKYFCCFCQRYFKNPGIHSRHMKNCHKEALKCTASRCPNYFKTEEDRQKHVQEKHDSKKYKCIYCKATYHLQGVLTAHIRNYHKDVSLKCEYSVSCPTWFKTKEDRQIHYKEVHEKGDKKTWCPSCNKKIFVQRIYRHFSVCHPTEKVIKCHYLFCKNYFKSEVDKLKHVQEVHEIYDEKFRCEFCDKFILKNMSSHIYSRHKDVAIKCNFHERCANYFKNVEDRDIHVREVHQAEKIRQPVQCLYCDKTLAGENTMRLHIKLIHSEISIKCQYFKCGAFFKSQEDLENHLSLNPKHTKISNNEKVTEKLFNCTSCEKSFQSKSVLNIHLKTQHGEKTECPFCKKVIVYNITKTHTISSLCKVCNQKFQCLGLLRSHNLTCKPVFQCPVCSKSFKLECQLNYHCKRKHTVPVLKWKGLQYESRGFKCEECFIYFSVQNILNNHKKVRHGPSSKLTCDFCKTTLFHKGALKLHISQKHLGLTMKDFQCPVCNLKMTCKNQMKKHVKTHLNKQFIPCKICDKVMSSATLKTHMQRFH